MLHGTMLTILPPVAGIVHITSSAWFAIHEGWQLG